MSGMPSVRGEPRYRLTDDGREWAELATRCACAQLWISDGVYQCHECGTVFGVVFGFSLPPRKLRGTRIGGVS